MPVTEITHIANNSSSAVWLYNFETPSDTANNRGWFNPGEERDLNIWIPWVFAPSDFARHHVRIAYFDASGVGPEHLVFAIWQADRGGQDLVRFSSGPVDEQWTDPGDPIPGISKVGGQRVLVLDDAGPSLQEIAPPAAPSSGTGWISLFRPDPAVKPPDYDYFMYQGEAGAPADVFVISVTDDARDVNDQVAISMNLSHVDDDGRAAGPVPVKPGQTVDEPFTGLRAEGLWTARMTDISRTLLRDAMTLTMHWSRDGSTGQGLASGPQVVIWRLVANPPGNDLALDAGEFVELMNQGDSAVDLAGWWLEDAQGAQLTIPTGYRIGPGATVRVHTGHGTNTVDAYFVGRGRAVWTNSGDYARLRDANGRILSQYSY
jgi:hypothetical protein